MNDESRVFDALWKSPAPSKVVAFAWRALLNRVPTKVNLALRKVIAPEESKLCVLCDSLDESSVHSFLHCEVASLVWFQLMVWLENVFITPPNLFVHWECWNWGGRIKKVKKGLCLIWHATV